MPAILVAAFLVAHGLVHLFFLIPQPLTASDPQWPFELSRSRPLEALGVEGSALRRLGVVLIALVLVGYAVAGLASAGIAPAAFFATGVIVGSVASAALLLAFFHRWLALGVAIDVVLLWATLVASWRPEGVPL